MNNEAKKAELLEKYNNWAKKNKQRLLISVVVYLIIILLNFIFLKNNKITILSSLLFFTYAIYIFSLIFYVSEIGLLFIFTMLHYL